MFPRLARRWLLQPVQSTMESWARRPKAEGRHHPWRAPLKWQGPLGRFVSEVLPSAALGRQPAARRAAAEHSGRRRPVGD
jgi:hypothetical protein